MPNSIALCGAVVLALWVATNALLVFVYRRELWRLWREPVFRHPILIVETDDWGAGPLQQADALREFADVLDRHRDATGRAPTLNLALVLAVPDGAAIASGSGYRRIELDEPLFAPVLSALRDGQSRGVFALQLHGMEHYWPASLMASADERVQAWLRQPAPAATEELPPHLQSRWVDATNLPSTPHPEEAVRAAAAEEVQAYARIFGVPPRVVVPPTFVWTRRVERAWAAQGLACVVTPGWRYTRRDGQGHPAGDEGPLRNGDRADEIVYLVRTDYFEPARGRDALHALRVLGQVASEGRPCLLENHRDNFIGEAQMCRHSLAELDKLYREASARHPGLRYLSSWELSRILRGRDPEWLADGTRERLGFVWQRLRNAGRPWKFMVLTGLAAAGGLFVRLFAVSPPRSARQCPP